MRWGLGDRILISQADNRTTISDLKLKAKDQLLGNYGIATGSFALLFALIYAVMTILTSAMTVTGASGKPMIDQNTIAGLVETRVLSLVIAALTAILTTGYAYLIRRIADGERASVSDVFYVFKNHPDKVIIITVILTAVQYIFLLPSTIVGYKGFVSEDAGNITGIDGRRFLLFAVLTLAGYILTIVFDLYFAMVYQIYLDDPDAGVIDIMKESFFLMKGNCFRYFYLILSFIGYYMLMLLSLGIASLWVIPYQTMTIVRFYYDLTGREDATISEVYEEQVI